MRVLSINTGQATALLADRSGNMTRVMSGIRKVAASSLAHPLAVKLNRLGLEGDEQVDLSVHGGLDKAVYLYPSEHYAFWRELSSKAGRGADFEFGKMGENLSTEGITEDQVWVGDQLHLGDSVILSVESPRNPCFKFNLVMGFSHAAQSMVQSGYCGFYCSVVRTGFLKAGDPLSVIPGSRNTSIAAHFRSSHRRNQENLF